LRNKALFLVALTVLIVLALQGAAELPGWESWWDGN
jgi:hypothetical protein